MSLSGCRHWPTPAYRPPCGSVKHSFRLDPAALQPSGTTIRYPVGSSCDVQSAGGSSSFGAGERGASVDACGAGAAMEQAAGTAVTAFAESDGWGDDRGDDDGPAVASCRPSGSTATARRSADRIANAALASTQRR